MLIEIRDGRASIYVRADQIASVEMPSARGEKADVWMVDGVNHPCTNPGAVRDTWAAWADKHTPTDTSLFGRIFGPL